MIWLALACSPTSDPQVRAAPAGTGGAVADTAADTDPPPGSPATTDEVPTSALSPSFVIGAPIPGSSVQVFGTVWTPTGPYLFGPDESLDLRVNGVPQPFTLIGGGPSYESIVSPSHSAGDLMEIVFDRPDLAEPLVIATRTTSTTVERVAVPYTSVADPVLASEELTLSWELGAPSDAVVVVSGTCVVQRSDIVLDATELIVPAGALVVSGPCRAEVRVWSVDVAENTGFAGGTVLAYSAGSAGYASFDLAP